MKIKTVLIVAGILGLAACIAKPRVSTKMADGVRLEGYKTYLLQAGQVYDSEAGKSGNQEGVERDLEADVREELSRCGLKSVDRNPDLTFRYVAGRRLRHTGQQQWSVNENEREWTYQEGAVTLIAADAAGRTVWSAHMQAVIDPNDKTHRQLKYAVGQAFKNYPSVTPQ